MRCSFWHRFISFTAQKKGLARKKRFRSLKWITIAFFEFLCGFFGHPTTSRRYWYPFRRSWFALTLVKFFGWPNILNKNSKFWPKIQTWYICCSSKTQNKKCRRISWRPDICMYVCKSTIFNGDYLVPVSHDHYLSEETDKVDKH